MERTIEVESRELREKLMNENRCERVRKLSGACRAKGIYAYVYRLTDKSMKCVQRASSDAREYFEAQRCRQYHSLDKTYDLSA